MKVLGGRAHDDEGETWVSLGFKLETVELARQPSQTSAGVPPALGIRDKLPWRRECEPEQHGAKPLAVRVWHQTKTSCDFSGTGPGQEGEAFF